MININKKLIYIVLLIAWVYSSIAFGGINTELLDADANFFNNLIYNEKLDNDCIALIKSSLDFLDEKTDSEYPHTAADFDIDSKQSNNKYYKIFADNCRKIYTDSTSAMQAQVAISTLFKAVSKKFSVRETQIKVEEEATAANQIISDDELFIRDFLQRDYDRELVTRFVGAYPEEQKLSGLIERSPTTVSKLKRPGYYGELTPNAKYLWSWAQQEAKQKHEEGKYFLGLSAHSVHVFADKLGLIDLSDKGIFCDEVAKTSSSSVHIMSASKAASYLVEMKDTFVKVDLSNNRLGDDGFKTILQVLSNDKLIKKIWLKEAKLTDKTFEDEENITLFRKLGSKPCIVTIDISGNTDVTISEVENLEKKTGVKFTWN